jgi:hypothetical protein
MDVANMDVDEGVLSHRCMCVCMFVYVCMCTNRYVLETYNLGAKNLHTATCACLHACIRTRLSGTFGYKLNLTETAHMFYSVSSNMSCVSQAT